MYRRFAFLEFALAAPRFLRHAVLRLDFMAAVFAEHAFGGGMRLGHGRVFSKLAFGINLFLNSRDHLLILRRRQPLFTEQIFLEAVNTVALAPELMHFLGDIRRGVV